MNLSMEDFPLPIVELSQDGQTIKWINLAAQEWLGRSDKSIKGLELSEIFLNSETIIEASARARQDFSPVSLFDFVLRRKNAPDKLSDLTVFAHETSLAVLIKLKGNNPVRSQSSDLAVSAMGRMLAHEIKNPLAGIHGAAQLLKSDVSSEEGLTLIDLIASEIDRIRRLTDRMENFGEPGTDNVEYLNVHEILANARRIVQSAADGEISFRESYDTSLPLILGDSDTMMQALLNLIKNAYESIQGSGIGGEIKLETAFRTGVIRHVGPEGTPVQLPIEIRVIDDGPGITDHVRHRLFQPFVTNKPAGQGLGLALVSKVAAAHGGLIEHRSRPGETIFSILLPSHKIDPNQEIQP